ncbi:putative RDD family membrane protein YckC [Flavobacterium sp. 2755]|uniref:RDD family protein n=1 Tax=Flavobacterium sp. 2755 TaxID=2817765 RepID=UPI00285ADB99|nr:RDD family protein [Flavobacterium sp. 2755]MDR6761106.1 putative RDD family membrane protein YckC [Flavobacterium sp. 2755]
MSNSTYILDEKLLASNGSRFINYLIDIVAIFFLIFVFGIVMALLANLFNLSGLLYWLGNMSDFEGQILFIFIAVFYYTFTEGVFGRTLGKFITGTVVVDENGEKPSFGTIFKRTFCRFIPFEAFSFLGSRGWHDSISDTYVANKKDLEKEVKLFHEFNLIGNTELN